MRNAHVHGKKMVQIPNGLFFILLISISPKNNFIVITLVASMTMLTNLSITCLQDFCLVSLFTSFSLVLFQLTNIGGSYSKEQP